MAKKKGKGKGGKKKEPEHYISDDEVHDGLALEGADAYEAEQDEQILQNVKKLTGRNRLKDASGGIDELYALDGDDTSSDEDMAGVEFDEDDHDFGDDQGDNDDDVRAWGGKKKHFYGGNPNDAQNKMSAKDGENDLDEAEAEEAESKALQMKQLEQMDESDFLDAFDMGGGSSKKAAASKMAKEGEAKVSLDISQLSKKERVALFHRQSPEFSGILADFECKMKELVEKLQPALDIIDEGQLDIADGPGVVFLRTKYHLILNYCTNILCYVMFKTKGTDLKLHPITARLVQFKQLLDQMGPLDEVVMPQIDEILASKDDLSQVSKAKQLKKTKTVAKKPKKKLKLLSKEKSNKTASENRTESPEELTTDERIALEVYNAMKSKKAATVPEQNESEDEGMEDEVPEKIHTDPEKEEERRAITYQIAKNKGLAPKRSKLQRNPRVKHRHKFEKAKVRRKGQVREVRKEVKKYAGEISGINARVKKGVKLK